LSKKGPGTVYSGDFEGSAEVVYKNIPITILETGQEIELVATARPGKGVDHAKHSPGLCYYRSLVEVKSNSKEVEEIVANSKGLISPEKKGNSWVCDLNDAEIDRIKKADSDAINELDE